MEEKRLWAKQHQLDWIVIQFNIAGHEERVKINCVATRREGIVLVFYIHTHTHMKGSCASCILVHHAHQFCLHVGPGSRSKRRVTMIPLNRRANNTIPDQKMEMTCDVYICIYVEPLFTSQWTISSELCERARAAWVIIVFSFRHRIYMAGHNIHSATALTKGIFFESARVCSVCFLFCPFLRTYWHVVGNVPAASQRF